MKVSSGRSPPGRAKILSCSLWAFMVGRGWGRSGREAGSRSSAERGAEAGVTLVGGVHEQLCLFDDLVGGFAARGSGPLLVDAEEILGEFPTGVGVEEEL